MKQGKLLVVYSFYTNDEVSTLEQSCFVTLLNVLELLEQALWWAWSDVARTKSLQAPRGSQADIGALGLHINLAAYDMCAWAGCKHWQAACQHMLAWAPILLPARWLSLSYPLYTP